MIILIRVGDADIPSYFSVIFSRQKGKTDKRILVVMRKSQKGAMGDLTHYGHSRTALLGSLGISYLPERR